MQLAGGKRTRFINEYVVRIRSNGDSDYTTWPLNGDKTPKKIAVLNEDLSWTDEKVVLIVEEAKSAIPQTRYYLSNGKNQSVSPFNLNIYTDPVLKFALYSTSKYVVYAIRKKTK